MPDYSALRILLLGAGHTNLLAAKRLRAALPDASIVLVEMATAATYSGMFPGWLAGHYTLSQMRVDVAEFAARHHIAHRHSHIESIDPIRRTATLNDGEVLEYDLAALDVGSHSLMPEIEGFAEHAVPIKPFHGLVARIGSLRPDAPVAIIGGGVAGVEIALSLARRQSGPVTLIEAGTRIAATLGPKGQRLLRGALDRAGVQVLVNAQVARIHDGALQLRDGSHMPTGMVLGVAGARAHGWLARCLPVNDAGFVRVAPTLQVEGAAGLFATGDCAAMMHAPRPKAGVYAVRQAPTLLHNLLATHHGTPLRPYIPQRDYLKIISLGGKTALAEWQGMTLHGRWLWRWKDRIDRRFMHALQM
ncbi:FAD-dependent oxidoreductase [Falsirhodobacter sp. alg1]|uniref:FAD-dependent oxidoreductase n=1 Tax=Falsirhodobacter sp. alg1 TaxID=1472418 RepID=UPI0005EE48CB|nr:FAD-dependent oxidoreductase [Falsirhodobacter sp. alg1]